MPTFIDIGSCASLALSGIVLIGAAACGSTGDGETGDDQNVTAGAPISGASNKAVREAIRATCAKPGGDLALDFFFDEDAQLRGTLRGSKTTELSVVKPVDRKLEPLQAVKGDDTVLRGPDGPFYIVSRFFPRFITEADTSFAAAHSSIKVVSETGAVTEAACKPDTASESASDVIASIVKMIPPSEYKGHGKTKDKLCSAVVARDGSSGNVTISIQPRKDDGTLGTATSTFILGADSTIKYSLLSSKKDVLFVRATTNDNSRPVTRLLTVDRPNVSSTYRVTIVSIGSNGGSTNFCDM